MPRWMDPVTNNAHRGDHAEDLQQRLHRPAEII